MSALEAKSEFDVMDQCFGDASDGSPTVLCPHDELEDVQGLKRNDKGDMVRLGKEQELARIFHFVSTLGFASVSACT